MTFQRKHQDPYTSKLPTVNGIPLEPINQILPQDSQGAIYIGDVDAAKDIAMLKKNKIGAVLTVAPNAGVSYSKRDVQMHQIIPADDQEDYDLAQHFNQSYQFIDKARKRTSILVHCMAGVSRSTTIVIAYLMRKYRWRTDQAYQAVKSKRRLTCPNLGFCKQLKQFQRQLGIGSPPPNTYDAPQKVQPHRRINTSYQSRQQQDQYQQPYYPQQTYSQQQNYQAYNKPQNHSDYYGHQPKGSYQQSTAYQSMNSPQRRSPQFQKSKGFNHSQYVYQSPSRTPPPQTARQKRSQQPYRAEYTIQSKTGNSFSSYNTNSGYDSYKQPKSSARKNYRPYQFSNYDRPQLKSPINKETMASPYFKSQENFRLRESNIRGGFQLRSSRFQPQSPTAKAKPSFRNENMPYDMGRSRGFIPQKQQIARNRSMERFMK